MLQVIDDFVNSTLSFLDENPDIGYCDVSIEYPDNVSSLKKTPLKSFVSFAISPKEPIYTPSLLNNYVNKTMMSHFRPEHITLAKEKKRKRHMSSYGEDQLTLPVLSSSKEYLLDKDDNSVIRQTFGGAQNSFIVSNPQEKDKLRLQIDYDIIVFPNKYLAEEYFPKKSHTFKEPYNIPLSALNNPITSKNI